MDAVEKGKNSHHCLCREWNPGLPDNIDIASDTKLYIIPLNDSWFVKYMCLPSASFM
jgi:hypothetical protein